MKDKLLAFLKGKAMVLLMVGGLGTYVLVAGTTGSCPACATITQAVGIPSATAASKSNLDGQKAPSWTLMDVDGRNVSSTEFEGKIVLVDFWASWCPPCKKMIPGLIELQQDYRDQGFEVVGVSLDEGGAPTVKAFNEKYGVSYTSLLADAEVLNAFGGIQNIPTSFLIDQDGRIVSKHVGFLPMERLATQIKTLLASQSN